MTFDFDSVKQLITCPKTKTSLVLDENRLVNTDPKSRYYYPVIDEIPLLLPSEAKQLSAEQWSEIMDRHARNPQTGAPV